MDIFVETPVFCMSESHSLFIAKLEELLALNISYSAGESAAVDYVIANNGSITPVPVDEGGGVDLCIDGLKVSVFQPYSDIDRMYYEY